MDILEHLQDYDNLLNDSKNLLKKDGRIVISLPNFANIYVRLNLLIGRLPLADKGILDRTHLHLFTYRIIKNILRKHKLEIVEQRVTPIPVIEILPDILKRNVGYVLNFLLNIKTVLFKRLLGYQFIFICKKQNY